MDSLEQILTALEGEIPAFLRLFLIKVAPDCLFESRAAGRHYLNHEEYGEYSRCLTDGERFLIGGTAIGTNGRSGAAIPT